MKIKVCGMRDKENIQNLLVLEPDFIGFIFYKKSKRFVTKFPEVEIPSAIKKVGIFVNETVDEVLKVTQLYQLDAIQLHGNESPLYCRLLKENNLMVFKAFSVNDVFDFSQTETYQAICDYFLFDTKGKDYGGNGVKFNWQILENYKGNTPFLLSGGITKIDADEIKKMDHKLFAGIDINSGFEIKPALKNINDIKEFKENLK